MHLARTLELFPPRTRYGVDVRIQEWKPKVEAGGAFFGALLGTRLLGFAVIGAPLQGAAELCALFGPEIPPVGAGILAVDHVERAARDLGAKSPLSVLNIHPPSGLS